MLSAESSRTSHALQNLQLIALSLILLPLDTFILFFSYAVRIVARIPATTHRARLRSQNSRQFQPRNVLVTGMGMTKGLVLARLFYIAGHNVVGADFEPWFLPFPLTCGHVSRSIKKFCCLAKPDGTAEGSARYAHSLLGIIKKEKIDLWVSCSGVASAVEDGQAKETIERETFCRCVQYNVPTTQLLHEKHTFIDYVYSLGLTVPDTHTVTSKAAALKVLDDAERTGRKYILKFIGTDDAVRGDMTLLPFDMPSQTKPHVSRLDISEARPWILQQYINGSEFCTHALVVRGQVKAFVACPSAELLMHYEALPSDSSLSRSMLRFTQEVAGSDPEAFTGHLSFDFLVDAKEKAAADRDPNRIVQLYPIECNPRAHTAVCLFNDTPEIIDAYMSVLEPAPKAQQTSRALKKDGGDGITNGNATVQPIYPNNQRAQYCWLGHDLVEFILLPLRSLLSSLLLPHRRGNHPNKTTLGDVVNGILIFINHLLFWHDGSYEIWDPLPAFWLYHVYWPYQFAVALMTGRKWTRINVSTTKMFGC